MATPDNLRHPWRLYSNVPTKLAVIEEMNWGYNTSIHGNITRKLPM
jgi:hypothetical protein